MYRSTVKIRVRYAETDRMGYVYYGNYATYFEVARVEALRQLGISYRSLEDAGILLPVLDYSVRYRRPAYYDDELEIRTVITELPKTRIFFSYEVVNTEGVTITTAETTLVFIDKATGKPRSAPDQVLEAMKPWFTA
jgi:acyl-CoA thioester hydrolase